MTDDRSLERAARSWLEEGPTRAPDRAVAAALSRIQTTRQDRDLRIPWRLPTMTPIARLAAIAVIAAVAVGGSIFVIGNGLPGFGGKPTPSPAPTASPSLSPTVPTAKPFTGACTLVTSKEAETTAGAIGLGAVPAEAEISGQSICLFSNGGGETVLRLTWVRTGGTPVYDTAAAAAGVESVPALGDAAVYDPARGELHVRKGDGYLVVFASDRSLTRETAVAQLAVPRM
jgi:hypothetical protein